MHENPINLIGPFHVRRTGIEGFEIIDANGDVGIWVYGEERAAYLLELLNAAYQKEPV